MFIATRRKRMASTISRVNHGAQNPLKEPGPRVERRAISDGKESECDEKHQHGDTGGERVCRQVAPLTSARMRRENISHPSPVAAKVVMAPTT